MGNREIFRSMSYTRHNHRRLEHLQSLGFDLHNKKILELGAGIGDHTHFYLDRRCEVLALEARKENVDILRMEFEAEKVVVCEHDLENAFYEKYSKELKGVDYIHCYGLLYHLKNPELLIDECSKLVSSVLLLETCVSDGEGEALNICDENQELANQSFSGHGCRPTREWVFNNLKKRYSYVYMSVSQPNHREFPLVWNLESNKNRLTRAVFVASNTRIVNPLLAQYVLNRHTSSY